MDIQAQAPRPAGYAKRPTLLAVAECRRELPPAWTRADDGRETARAYPGARIRATFREFRLKKAPAPNRPTKVGHFEVGSRTGVFFARAIAFA